MTGCGGFIGSTLVDALLENGDAVVGIDAFADSYPRAHKEAAISGARTFARFSLHEADLTDPAVPLAELASGVEGIFHCAAQPGVRASWGSSFQIYAANNVMATQRLFEVATQLGVRVVFASSSSIYGNAEAYPTAEDVVPQPVSPYGVTKLACEHLAAAYAANFDLDVVSLRYFTVYGPRQRPDMAFSRVVAALLDGKAFAVFGDGRQSRDFTFIDDVVAATLLAMRRAPGGAIYNVGGGSEATLSDVIDTLIELSGRELDVQFQDAAAGDVRRTLADTRRIRDQIGWVPEVPLRSGLKAQLDAAVAARGAVSSPLPERRSR